MKAKEFAKEIGLTLTVEEFDALFEYVTGIAIHNKVLDKVSLKMREINNRLETELPYLPSKN